MANRRKHPIDFRSSEEALMFTGAQDRHLRILKDKLDLDVTARGLTLTLEGDEAELEEGVQVCEKILHQIRSFGHIDHEHLGQIVATAGSKEAPFPKRPEGPGVSRALCPRGRNQEKYLATLDKKGITFAVGPSGTGKTYLAVAKAVEAFKSGRVRRIVLTRPAVEAGEHLGFLPGDFRAKVNPYLRPLYDALYAFLSFEAVRKYMEIDLVEVAPLAFMRGRTLEEAFVILDEAQNTTVAQMKMFLTRMGTGSRMAITGDLSQSDLEGLGRNGLEDALGRLGSIRDIGFVRFTGRDIVRHPLVGKIVAAYEKGRAK